MRPTKGIADRLFGSLKPFAKRPFTSYEDEDRAIIESGKITAETAARVVFEAVYVLNKSCHVDRAKVIDTKMALVSMPRLRKPNKAAVQRALSLCRLTGRISYADAYHLVLGSETSHKRIASFDREVSNALPNVSRIE